jgi:hypothetical protein
LCTASGGSPNWIALTNGQIVIGSTSGAPAAGSLTSTGSSLTITGGSNTINLEVSAAQDISNAVVLVPSFSSRNVIAPTTADLTGLIVKASSGSFSTAHEVFAIQNSAATASPFSVYRSASAAYALRLNTNANTSIGSGTYGSITMDSNSNRVTGSINTSSSTLAAGGNIYTNAGAASGALTGGAGGNILLTGGGSVGNNTGGNSGSINLSGAADDGISAFVFDGGSITMTGTNGGAAGSINLSGGTGYAGGNAGGSITMVGGAGAGTSTAGSITTSGGNTAGGSGGSITTSGSGANAGGAINTAGGATAAGGSITTNNGGGSINTTGNGSIQLGVSATRTTLNGSGSAVTVTLPATTTTLVGLAGTQTITGAKTFNASALLVNGSGATTTLASAAASSGKTVTFPNITGSTLLFSNTTSAATNTQSAQTSGTAVFLSISLGAHTGQTASTEVNDLDINLNRTVTWAAGALTTQRAIRIQAPTYAFASSSTLTTASTVAISGAPVTGTNATLTNSYALNIESGGTRFGGSIVFNRTTTATSYSVLTTDYIIAVTSTASARTITLPTAVNATGRKYVIKDESGGAATNNITINTTSSQTIDGASTKTISSNYGSATVYSDGSNWFSI